MKNSSLLVVVLSLLCFSQLSSAQMTSKTWGFGIRQHTEQPDYPNISFGDELSYGLSLSALDSGGYWQAALLYTPDIKGIEGVNYAITPEINLMMSENALRIGVGGAKTYVSADVDGGWRDFFWELIVGLGLPDIGAGSLEVRAIYMFDEWGNVKEFDSGNLEYAIWMGIPF